MLTYFLRLYLRWGSKRAARRLHSELRLIYDETDRPRYTGMAIDDFFYRVARFMRKHTPFDAAKTLDEEKERAKRNCSNW